MLVKAFRRCLRVFFYSFFGMCGHALADEPPLGKRIYVIDKDGRKPVQIESLNHENKYDTSEKKILKDPQIGQLEPKEPAAEVSKAIEMDDAIYAGKGAKNTAEMAPLAVKAKPLSPRVMFEPRLIDPYIEDDPVDKDVLKRLKSMRPPGQDDVEF